MRKHSTSWDYREDIAAMARVQQFPQQFAYMHGWYESNDWIFLAMGYFELGDLLQHLDSKIPQKQAKMITRQLCSGLVEMHRMGFAHRDLKPQNVFIFSRTPTIWDVRIGDFGIAKRVQQNETAFRTMTGTQAYTAPEMFPYLVDDQEEHTYTHAVDIWALGIMLYQMLTLELPFGDRVPLHRYCKNQCGFPETPLLREQITPTCISFIKALLRPLPSERPTSEAAVAHPWLHEITVDSSNIPLDHTIPKNLGVERAPSGDLSRAISLRPMMARINWAEPDPVYTYVQRDEHNNDDNDETSTKCETLMTPITANITSVMATRLPSYPRDETIHHYQDNTQRGRVATSDDSDDHDFAAISDRDNVSEANGVAAIQPSRIHTEDYDHHRSSDVS